MNKLWTPHHPTPTRITVPPSSSLLLSSSTSRIDGNLVEVQMSCKWAVKELDDKSKELRRRIKELYRRIKELQMSCIFLCFPLSNVKLHKNSPFLHKWAVKWTKQRQYAIYIYISPLIIT